MPETRLLVSDSRQQAPIHPLPHTDLPYHAVPYRDAVRHTAVTLRTAETPAISPAGVDIAQRGILLRPAVSAEPTYEIVIQGRIFGRKDHANVHPFRKFIDGRQSRDKLPYHGRFPLLAYQKVGLSAGKPRSEFIYI